MLNHIEELVAEGKYAGFINGVAITEEDRKAIKKIPNEDLKVFVKNMIEKFWKDTLDKQKNGVEKLGLALRPYLKDFTAKIDGGNL